MAQFASMSPVVLMRFIGAPERPQTAGDRPRTRRIIADRLNGGMYSWRNAGLHARPLGLSRGDPDDPAQLDAGMVLYDTRGRSARDRPNETRDWREDAG